MSDGHPVLIMGGLPGTWRLDSKIPDIGVSWVWNVVYSEGSGTMVNSLKTSNQHYFHFIVKILG